MADPGGLTRPEARPPVPETGGGLGASETAPETGRLPAEGAPDAAEQMAERAAVEQERVQAAAAPIAPAPPRKDPLLADVEHLLEEGLQETYVALPPADRARFRAGGEKAATRIGQMIAGGKLKLKLVWKLLRDWLRTIPGASRFFVEQEAKIKTDRIIHLAEKQKRR